MAQSNEVSKFLIKKYQTISEKYELLEQIDRGAYGDVILARDVLTNNKKAIKIMRLMDDVDDENVNKKYIKKLMNEAELMSKLSHPNILKFDECFQYNIYFCIVSEYCEKNLTKVLQMHIGSKSRPSDESIYEWLYKLSQGLNYLHDEKVIHRDIKPSNILFKNNEIKIADFGESKDIIGTITKTTAQHGTLYYMPPEVLRGEKHTYKSDVWSLGCVFYEINNLELTFDGDNQRELEINILNKKMKNLIIEESKINDLIDQMICIDETKRFSIKNVLSHQYFGEKKDREVDENKLIDQPFELCIDCGKPILYRIIRPKFLPNKIFHPECFYCTECKKNLDGVPCSVDASSHVLCIDCFHNKYAPRCHICLLLIVPDPGLEETTRIVAMDKSFHVHCYKCEDCGLSLQSDKSNGCYPIDDHIYCKSCHIQRIRKNK